MLLRQCESILRRCTGIALLLAVSVLPWPATAQRVDFTQPLQYAADAGLDLGSSDSRTSRQAVLGVGDQTWVTGRRDDPGEDDVWVARFGPGGQQELLQRFDLGGRDAGVALAPASGGAVYLAARTQGSGQERVVVMRIESDGRLAWRRDLDSAGTWLFLQFDLVLAPHGADALLVGFNAIQSGDQPVIVLARLQDQGTTATIAWRSTLQPAARGYEDLAIAPSPDGSRFALSMRVRLPTFEERTFVALLSTGNGGVINSSQGSDDVRRVLPVQYAPDGSLRVAALDALLRSVRLLRFSANGAPAPATSLACSVTGCLIDGIAVTSDRATVVIGTDNATNAAVLLRFAADGAPTWTRRYPFGAASSGRAISAIGTAVDIALNARLVADDRSTTRWLVGRVDAGGAPTDTTGFVVAASRSASLVTMQRSPNGVLSLAGDEFIDLGRVVVAQVASGETNPRFVTGPAPLPSAAEFFTVDGVLSLDPEGRPLVAFGTRGNDARGFGIRAFATDGTLRWSAESDPQLREASAAVAIDPLGRLSAVSSVGNFPASQFALRRFAPDGALLDAPTFTAEAGFDAPRIAAAADGTRVIAGNLGENSLVVRFIEANGQTRWRRVIGATQPGWRVVSVAYVASGDVALLYTRGSGVDAGLTGLRLAASSGLPGTSVTISASGFAAVPRVVQDGARFFAAVLDNDGIQFACLDLAAPAVCFERLGPSSAAATLGDLALDPAQATLFVALATGAESPRPRMIALDSNTGAERADVVLSDRPVQNVRGIFVRAGNPVLVANRLPDADTSTGTPGVELFTLTPQGQLLEHASLNSGQRLEADRVRYDPVAGRAYLIGTRTPLQGASEPSLIGVRFDTPARIFADGFD